MSMHNQTHEAARQIIERASDLHGALALAGRQDLVDNVISIRRKAACIMKMERPEEDIRERSRLDMMNAIGCLAHVINRNLDEWPDFNGEEVVSIVRLAETCVQRGYGWLDMVAKEDEKIHSYSMKNNNGECADDRN
jgi:hypothetical protein